MMCLAFVRFANRRDDSPSRKPSSSPKAALSRGPEKLAERLHVQVRYSAINGCDGWCLFCEGRAIIRINTRLVKSRQRFTLAHEVGHLLLDIPSVIGESFSDILRSDDAKNVESMRWRLSCSFRERL